MKKLYPVMNLLYLYQIFFYLHQCRSFSRRNAVMFAYSRHDSFCRSIRFAGHYLNVAHISERISVHCFSHRWWCFSNSVQKYCLFLIHAKFAEKKCTFPIFFALFRSRALCVHSHSRALAIAIRAHRNAHKNAYALIARAKGV